MNEKIEKIIKSLDTIFENRLNELNKGKFIEISCLQKMGIPKLGGIYVFYDNLYHPIYVGRTKNIRQRIQLHTRNSSKSESATFAFRLTKIYFENKEHDDIFFKEGKKKKTRTELMDNDSFNSVFKENVDKLKNMKLKFIIEENDVLQTILEPYFSVKLGTYPKYNSFETH